MPKRTYQARAKINLALHVTGQRPDGYHLLDSLVAFAEYGDTLTVKPASALSLAIKGPFSKGLEADENNLIVKAARLLKEAAVPNDRQWGASLALHKNLPVSSGIGGGSADAAATLHALNELWECGLSIDDLKEIGLKLGADVPMCVSGISSRVSGIGEIIDPVSLPSLPIVLINPGIGVSTPLVFKDLHNKQNPEMQTPPKSNDHHDWIAYLLDQRNDLQYAAQKLVPEIGEILSAFDETKGCLLARMSGSGATCFGIYGSEEEAQAAAGSIQRTKPNWWVQASRTAIGPNQ